MTTGTKILFHYGRDTLVQMLVSGPAQAAGAVYDALTGQDDVATLVSRIEIIPKEDVSEFFGSWPNDIKVAVQYRDPETGHFKQVISLSEQDVSDDMKAAVREIIESMPDETSDHFKPAQLLIDLPESL